MSSPEDPLASPALYSSLLEGFWVSEQAGPPPLLLSPSPQMGVAPLWTSGASLLASLEHQLSDHVAAALSRGPDLAGSTCPLSNLPSPTSAHRSIPRA